MRATMMTALLWEVANDVASVRPWYPWSRFRQMPGAWCACLPDFQMLYSE